MRQSEAGGRDGRTDRSGHDEPGRRTGRRRDRVAELQRRVERLESVMRSVEHDVRGALVVGSGHLDAARTDPEPDTLDGIEHAHDRIEALLEDLRATAAAGDTDRDRRPVDVATVCREAWEGIDAPGATLRVEGAPTVVANETRLLRLLENLLRNAVQHGDPARGSTDRSAGGGSHHDHHGSTARTTMASNSRDADLQLVAPGPGGENVPTPVGSAAETRRDLTVTVGALDGAGFFVADDGPGIPAGEYDRIFEPGYTTSETGTGLGLAIVQEVADEHGWTVRATTSDAGGARFEVAGGNTPADPE